MTKNNKKIMVIEALYVELVFDFLFSLHDDPTSIAHFRTSIWNFGSATTSSVLLKKVFTIRVFQSLENNGYPILILSSSTRHTVFTGTPGYTLHFASL